MNDIIFQNWFIANQKELVSYYDATMQSIFETIENFAMEVYFEFDNLPKISTL